MTVTPHMNPNSKPVAECRGLTLGYGDEIILRDVNLAVPRGMFLPFVGPNGAGKTTLLRAFLGLVKPLAGALLTPFREDPPGYVSQQKAIDPLYPVSVLEIVLMGAYRRMGWHGRRERETWIDTALRLLARFGMQEHCHKTFDQLSGGMRQKTMVARAMAGGANVLIMDEPTTELDHRAQRELLVMLHDASAREGRTVLLVHHGLEMIADRVAQVCLVHEGTARIVPVGEARF